MVKRAALVERIDIQGLEQSIRDTWAVTGWKCLAVVGVEVVRGLQGIFECLEGLFTIAGCIWGQGGSDALKTEGHYIVISAPAGQHSCSVG
ncbi:hypothetical protein ES703_20866 [subsurface metagenome]